MQFHNGRMNSFSKKGMPWVLVKTIQLTNKSEAMSLEKQIKKMVLNDI